MDRGRRSSKSVLGTSALIAILVVAALGMITFGQAPAEPKKPAEAAPSIQVSMGSCPPSFVDLFKLSQEQKKGLTFYVSGMAIGGVVVKAAGDGTVEVRNQEFGRLVIRLEAVSAVGMN